MVSEMCPPIYEKKPLKSVGIECWENKGDGFKTGNLFLRKTWKELRFFFYIWVPGEEVFGFQNIAEHTRQSLQFSRCTFVRQGWSCLGNIDLLTIHIWLDFYLLSQRLTFKLFRITYVYLVGKMKFKRFLFRLPWLSADYMFVIQFTLKNTQRYCHCHPVDPVDLKVLSSLRWMFSAFSRLRYRSFGLCLPEGGDIVVVIIFSPPEN